MVKEDFYKFLLVLALFAGAIGKSNGQKIDTLVFDNGNVVTGELKWLELGIAQYKTDAAGTLKVKWERVKLFKSPRMFDVRLENGNRYLGSLAFGDEDYEIKIKLLNNYIEFPISELVDIHVLSRNFWQRLDGFIDIGFNYTKASEVTQFNLGSQVTYYGERWSSKLTLNSIITTQPGKDQTRKQDLTLLLRRFLKKNWDIFALGGLEQNTELGLDLRTLISLGAIKDIFQTRRNYFNAIGGLSVNKEWSDNFESNTTNLEALIGLTFKKYKHITPKIDISSNLLVYPNLSNLGRVRVNFEAKAKFEIVSDLFLGLTFYNNYDNQPATEGASKNDWGIITSVGYSF